MNSIKENDGIYPEYGKAVYRFPRTIKEAFDRFAEVEKTEDEFIQRLDQIEREYTKPAMRIFFALAALYIVGMVVIGAAG